MSHAGNQFYLFFGELLPPAVADLKKAMAEKKIEQELSVRVVARVALSPKSMFEFLEILKKNAENYSQIQNAPIDLPPAKG